jgi:hypothetical protein
MNRSEHLLACLAEECDEVGQRVMKALRFGLDEIQRDQPLNNAERIAAEYADLIAVYEICRDEGLLQTPDMDIAGKREKIERYMLLAIEKGALTEDTGNE